MLPETYLKLSQITLKAKWRGFAIYNKFFISYNSLIFIIASGKSNNSKAFML